MTPVANLPPEELARRSAANLRVGLILAAVALAIFLLTMFLRN
jgi:hypothetical protein